MRAISGTGWLMRAEQALVSGDLVLVGGGHAHVTVLKKFAMQPVPGVRVTLISRELQAPYSGMLPGYIAGHYTFDEAHIDLMPLCRYAGVRFFHDEVVGLDVDDRRLLCRDRPDLHYDVLSVNIGSAPDVSAVPGASANVTPVKPIDAFVDNWRGLRERMLQRKQGARIGVVGAGAGGVELTLALQQRLRKLLVGIWPDNLSPEFHLFTDADDVLVTYNRRVRAKFRRVLAQRRINVHTAHKAVEVRPGALRCANGAAFALDEILWVTTARAQGWLAQAGLDVDEQGFVKVHDTLESVSHPGVFAAGDSAAAVNHPRPKSGVFAVRQGPPLALNLWRKLLGRPLKPFAPQRQCLSLISTGDKYAIASRGAWALEGRWVWRWKDWIDRRFMCRFNQLAEMQPQKQVSDTRPAGDAHRTAADAMRCGGCGAKVGASALENALAGLKPVSRDDVLVGLREPDDAAVVSIPAGKVIVHSVDAFRAFIDDPYLFGQVAANHALSDLYAMGAEPQTALALVTIPHAPEEKVEELLSDLLQGALKVLNSAGAALVGGHTGEGEELTLGFAVNGLIDRRNILRKGGLRADDRILLTKPIGAGALFAADMRCRAKGSWVVAALASMLQSNRAAAECLFEHGATACTDVTGFGLLGHLAEMLKAADVDIELDLDAVPLLQGARETVAAGILSSLHPQNQRVARVLRDAVRVSDDPRYPLLFDPQTSGGLLAGIPGARAEACVAALHRLGYSHSALIGSVLPGSGRPDPVKILL